MRNYKLFAIAAVLLPCFSSSLMADQELKIRALSFQPGFPVEIHAHEPDGSATGGMVEIKSFLNHEANVVRCKGTRLVFTRRSRPDSATDMNEMIGQIEFPATSKSWILLFTPETVEQGEFKSKVFAIDDSAKGFPAGSFQIANLTTMPIKIELEKETYEFTPGEMRNIPKPPFGENQSASMEAYFKKDDKWMLLSSGSWPNPGTKRVLQILTENPATKQIDLKGVRDVAVAK
jgi:hypothetical protein